MSTVWVTRDGIPNVFSQTLFLDSVKFSNFFSNVIQHTQSYEYKYVNGTSKWYIPTFHGFIVLIQIHIS